MEIVKRQRIIGCALVFIWLIAVAVPRVAAMPLRDRTPVAEFEVIWDGMLSTSEVAADDSEWKWLRAQGVTSVVNLDDCMFDVGRYGFEGFLWVPLGAGTPRTQMEAEHFLKFVQRYDNQPVHISSAAGRRRATMIALLRYAIDGWSIKHAIAEGRRLSGRVQLSSEQEKWLLGWAETHPPGSHKEW